MEKGNNARDVNKTMTLRLKPPFHVVIIDPNEVVIRAGIWSGKSSSIKDNKQAGLLGRTMQLLDGLHSIEDIVSEVGEEHEEAVLDLFDGLFKNRIVEAAPQDTGIEELPPEARDRLEPAQAFLSYISNQPLSSTFSQLRKARVCLVGGGVIGTRVALQLSQAGIGQLAILEGTQVTDKDVYLTPWLKPESVGENRGSVLARCVGEFIPTTTVREVNSNGGDLTDAVLEEAMQEIDYIVVATDLPNPSLYKQINDVALKNKVTWTVASLDGAVGLVGPTFIPYKTCCYACYEMRLESNMFYFSAYQHYKKAAIETALKYQQAYVGLPSLADIIAGFLTYDCVRNIATGFGFTPGKITRVDFQSGIIETNDVLKLPRCPACGKTARGKPNVGVFHTFERVIKELGV